MKYDPAVIILIPAYNPDAGLVNLVKHLDQQFPTLVVDDGSCSEKQYIFDQLSLLPRCRVIHHRHNLGKGMALKTGFQYILDSFEPPTIAVTADADGQHAVSDIIRIAQATMNKSDNIVLGVRNLKKSVVPLKNRVGNFIVRWMFAVTTGTRLIDAQTGLRGIPRGLIDSIAIVNGKRYNFESNMLLEVIRQHIAIQQIPIQTIYLNRNHSSHFKPFFDSLLISWPIIKYGVKAYIWAVSKPLHKK